MSNIHTYSAGTKTVLLTTPNFFQSVQLKFSSSFNLHIPSLFIYINLSASLNALYIAMLWQLLFECSMPLGKSLIKRLTLHFGRLTLLFGRITLLLAD